MKKLKLSIIIFLCTILSFNCKKEFLTKLPTTSEVASGISSIADLQSALNGMYYDLRAVSGNNISGETNSNARDIPIMGDLKADNTYLSTLNSGRYIAQNNYTFDYTDTYDADIWIQDYVSVRDANLILTSKLPSSVANSEILGEAYCARALSYFQLVNHYATTYSLGPTALGVPIVLNVTNLTAKPKRSTVDSVYALILSDLNAAYGQMSGFKGSFYFSKYAARALQARVYQFKGDWKNALAASLDVIQNGGFALTPINSLADTSKLTAYWANTSMSTGGGETIFELNESPTVNNGGNSEAAFYGQGSGTYGDALCTRELYALYSPTDARRNLIYKGVRFSTTDSALIVNKYPNYNNPTAKDNEKIIRLAEMYLIAAEAYMNLGDMANANKYLNIIAINRDPVFKGYNDSGAQLLTDILNERRKEFAFEGYRFFDLIRLNLPIVRPAANNEYPAGSNLIGVGNFRRILPIPKYELDVNPNIVQNPSFQK